MKLFIDTSAFYSLLDREDINHLAARTIWRRAVSDGTDLITSNYVLIETTALLQHRLGIAAVRDFDEGIAGVIEVLWIDKSLHEGSLAALLVANRRRLSLVDCTSFALCRKWGIERAFAFDPHFEEQGLFRPDITGDEVAG